MPGTAWSSSRTKHTRRACETRSLRSSNGSGSVVAPAARRPLDVLPAADDPRRCANVAGLVQETRAVVESGDGVIVLGGATDDALSWLLTGEALSSLWLEATTTGLSVVPLRVPIEVDDVRQQLQGVLPDDGLYPHLLVRIGWQAIGRSELPRTPRRPLAEVLRS